MDSEEYNVNRETGRRVSIAREKIEQLPAGASYFVEASNVGPIRTMVCRIQRASNNRRIGKRFSVFVSPSDPSMYEVMRTDSGEGVPYVKPIPRTVQKRHEARADFARLPDDLKVTAVKVCSDRIPVEIPYWSNNRANKEERARILAACKMYMKGGREEILHGTKYVRSRGYFEWEEVPMPDGSVSLKFWRTA